MRKLLRALYLVMCLVISLPIIVGWFVWMFVLGVIYAAKNEVKLSDYLKEGVVKPVKFGMWLYGNIIKYGNKYSKYSYDEFAI